MKEKFRDKNRSKKDPLLNEIFFNKYKTIKKLGEGSFGKVYKAEYNGEYFALKFENRSKQKSLLEAEGTIMTYLQGPNIPIIKSYGYSGDYNLLVMQLMDKSLEDILRIRKTFSIKTTALIGFQLIGVLHYIHDKNIIHRDVKPDNCVMGSAELSENMYLIDFGLAKKYRSSRTLKQYPLTRKRRLTGTARYASIHALEGYEQSRRDDMESVGYILAYLLRGGLPWQGMKLKSKDNKYKNILEKKREISSQELFKGFPNEFSEILDYTKKLEYLEEPEYEMLRNKLMSLCKRLGYDFDYIYDWTTEKDLDNRKNRSRLKSLKTQSTLSLRNITKSSKSIVKEKFTEKSVDDLFAKTKKYKTKNKADNNKNEIVEKKEKIEFFLTERKEEQNNDIKQKDQVVNNENVEIKDNTINEDEHENDEDIKENDKKLDDNNKNIEKKEQKEDNKSIKTNSFENNEENKDNNNQNDSNGAQMSEEEIEQKNEVVCCIM